MRFSRRSRFLPALVALLGLLFAQLAVASYACPGEEAMAMARMMDAEAPCCGDAVADPEPALCQAHCQQGDRSLDKPPAPSPALAAAALPLPAAAQATGPPIGAPPGEQASLLARATAPPLAIRHCCFRI